MAKDKQAEKKQYSIWIDDTIGVRGDLKCIESLEKLFGPFTEEQKRATWVQYGQYGLQISPANEKIIDKLKDKLKIHKIIRFAIDDIILREGDFTDFSIWYLVADKKQAKDTTKKYIDLLTKNEMERKYCDDIIIDREDLHDRIKALIAVHFYDICKTENLDYKLNVMGRSTEL